MVFLGAVMLAAATFVLWREYAAYLKKGVDELSGFLAFIRNMKERMECYLELPADWAGGFRSPELEGSGFLFYVREGMDVGEAYEKCENSLCICDEAKDALRALFDRFGEGYLDTELSFIKSSIEKLSEIEASLKIENGNKIKAVGAMLGAVAMGIVILVI